MTGSASNAGAEDGSSESSFALDEPLRSTSVLPTKQPHAAPPAPPAPGAHEGVPRGGAANGGAEGCGAAGAEGAAGGDEAQGAERFRGSSDSVPSTRDGLDTARSDDAPRPVAGHNVAVCPASRAIAFEVVQRYLLSVWTTLSSEYNLSFSIPDDAAINTALRDADWDPLAVCEAFGKRIFATSFDLDGEGGERFGGHERRGTERTAANDTASQTSSADAPSEQEAGATVSSPFRERRPFGTSSNIQTEEPRTPRKGAASPKKPAAKSSPFYGPPVPPLEATPSKHIPPTVRAEFPDLAERSYAELSEIRAKAGWPTVSRTRKAPPSAKPARRPLFPDGVYASFAQLEAPPSPALSEATPSHGLIVPAVLTDVPDDWENGDHCPIVQRLHKGQLAFFDRVKHVRNRHGLHPFWNLLRLPWSRSAKSTVRLLAQILHYQTTEGARGLKELHCAAARRSNGDLRETTWQCEEEAVGREVMEVMIQLDIFPFSFDFETSPANEFTKKVLDFVMREWDEKVLSVLYREDVTIALSSKATAIMWAKYRLGGNGRDIDTLVDSYESNPSKYVSASANEFLAPAHPSSILKPRFWSNMEVKCNDRDAFGTAILRLVTNDPSAECTYFRGIFEDNSSIIRLCQLVYLQGCSQGGSTRGKMFTEASALWKSEEDMSPEHWEALLACSRGGDNQPPELKTAKNSHQEMVDILVRCTSASERLHLFGLKSHTQLNKFIVANELDLALSDNRRFKRLKDIYLQKHADDDKLTVALATEEGRLREMTEELGSSTLRGVRQKPSGRWAAQTYHAGKSRCIGTFGSQEEAALGYKVARRHLDKACVGDGTDEEREAGAKQNVDLAKEAARLAVEGASKAKLAKDAARTASDGSASIARRPRDTSGAANDALKSTEQTKKAKKDVAKDPTLRGLSQRPSGRWQAQIHFAGKSQYLGTFGSQEEAALGFKVAQRLLEKASVAEGSEEEREAETKRNVDLAKEAARLAVEGASLDKLSEEERCNLETHRRASIMFHENMSEDDAPMLMKGSRQPAEVVGRWLSSRKPEWRSSRRKRSLDTSEKAESLAGGLVATAEGGFQGPAAEIGGQLLAASKSEAPNRNGGAAAATRMSVVAVDGGASVASKQTAPNGGAVAATRIAARSSLEDAEQEAERKRKKREYDQRRYAQLGPRKAKRAKKAARTASDSAASIAAEKKERQKSPPTEIVGATRIRHHKWQQRARQIQTLFGASSSEMVDAPPGALGLVVDILPIRGARITDIKPECKFRKKVSVGDIIGAVDGLVVGRDTLKFFQDRDRQLQIIRLGARQDENAEMAEARSDSAVALQADQDGVVEKRKSTRSSLRKNDAGD